MGGRQILVDQRSKYLLVVTLQVKAITKDVIEDVGTGRSGNVGAGVSSFQEFLNDYLVPQLFLLV